MHRSLTAAQQATPASGDTASHDEVFSPKPPGGLQHNKRFHTRGRMTQTRHEPENRPSTQPTAACGGYRGDGGEKQLTPSKSSTNTAYTRVLVVLVLLLEVSGVWKT